MKKNPCVLILVDGLRPDAIATAPMPTIQALAPKCLYAGTAQSLMPNCTLPCHFSIFHSVVPERHGITTNTWVPQVRPIPGLFDVLKAQGKEAAFAYNWEELRDLGRPGSLSQSFCIRIKQPGTDAIVTDHAIQFLQDGADFVFCYLGEVDETGHKYSWMSPEYLQVANKADQCIARILEVLPEGGSVVIMADHGGHDRTHGTTRPEDMTIPLYIYAPQHEAVAGLASSAEPDLLDIAPTLAVLCGVEAPADWDGRALVN